MSHRLSRALLWGAGLLAAGALAILVATPLAIRAVVTPGFVATRASSALGREVSVGAVGLHFKPMLRIRLEGVAIAPDLTLGTVDVGLRVVSLLDRKIEPAIIEVEDAALTLVRQANGGFGFYGAIPTKDVGAHERVDFPERDSPPALPSLPKIDLRRVSVAFVDHAVADPPLRLSFQLQRLELHRFASGERPRLSVAAAMGEDGKGGLLTLDAELGPLEPEKSIGEQPIRAQSRLAGLVPASFVPYLPSGLDLRHLEGVLEGNVTLEGRATGDLAADLAISLVDGGVDLAGVRFSAPRFEGRLERTAGELEVTGARLEAPAVDLADHQVRNLRSSFSVAAGTLEVESLDVDSHTGSWRRAGIAGQEGAADLELHVRGTGSIALRGRLCLPSNTGESGGQRLGVQLPEVEVQDAELEVIDPARPEVPAVSLQVSRLHLFDFAEGEIASYSLEARIGEDGGGGTLTLRGNVGPLAWEEPLAEIPFSLQLAAAAVDAASLLHYAPEQWPLSRAEGLLAAEIDAEGPAGAGSVALALTLEDGSLEMAGVELEGRTTLEGRIHRRGETISVGSGRLTAEKLSFAARHAEDLRAKITLANDALEIESLELRAYDGTVHQAGRIVLGEVPSFDLRLEAAGVDAGRLLGLAVEGADPTLLEGEAAVRGRWTGQQSNWLDPVQGEGRILLHGGVLPSQDLLTAVSRSLLRLVPGSSNLLRERPRLAQLEELTSAFWFETGRVHTDDLRVRTDDFRVSGRGSIGHEGDLDFRLDVALTTRGVHKAFTLSRTHEEIRDAAMLPAVPVRVTGVAGSPRFRADATAVPVATLRGVLGLPGRAGAATRGAIGTAREAAGGLVGGAQRLRGSREPSEPPPDVLP